MGVRPGRRARRRSRDDFSRARPLSAERAGGRSRELPRSSPRSGRWRTPSRMRSPANATTHAEEWRRVSSAAATTSRSSAPPRAGPVRRRRRGVEPRDELRSRFPEATLTTRIQLPVTAAALAFAARRARARDRAARAGQAVRSSAGGGVLARATSGGRPPWTEGRRAPPLSSRASWIIAAQAPTSPLYRARARSGLGARGWTLSGREATTSKRRSRSRYTRNTLIRTMSVDHAQRAQGRCFLAALDLPVAERDAFLAEACGRTMRRCDEEVESLLQFHDDVRRRRGTVRAPSRSSCRARCSRAATG